MATYYKFAERQADSFVNWAEIGKGLTDMLQEEVKIREQKKAAIDQATRDNLKRLGEAPTGNHTGANTWTLEYADNARQAILLQDRLLKSGALKLKDYTVMRQNLNDGTDELFSVMKNYQAVFKEKSDRLNSTDPKNRSQALEMDLLAYTEKFADFANSRAIIDPNNFMVNVGLMEPDPDNKGVMKLSKTIATTGFLKNIQNTKFDYFDADAAADVVSKRMGKYVRETIDTLSRVQGQVITKEGIINSKEYDGIVDTALKSFLSNPFNMTSILTDTLVEDDQERPYVSNISGKEGNVIEYVFDPNTNLPTPRLTAEQESAIKKYMKEQIKFRLDDIEKVQVFNIPQPAASQRTAAPSGGGDIQQQLQGVKNDLINISKTFKQGDYPSTVFQPSAQSTQENLQKLFSSSPATSGKYKVKTMSTDPEDVKSKNLVVVTDNNNNLVVSYDMTKVPLSLEGRRGFDVDVIDKVINTEFERLMPGSFLMGGQQSGGASQFNPQ
jgi:hypothetical protein